MKSDSKTLMWKVGIKKGALQEGRASRGSVTIVSDHAVSRGIERLAILLHTTHFGLSFNSERRKDKSKLAIVT